MQLRYPGHTLGQPLLRQHLPGLVHHLHVVMVLSPVITHEQPHRQLIKDQDLVRELESVRARAGASHLSLLRTFDIMCWMLGEPAGPGQDAVGA